jgi:hypothetical protein
MSFGYFPQRWKPARILLIPKSGKNRRYVTNYRPIALLATLGKLLERLVLPSIESHIQNRDKRPPEQYGFRYRHSTTHQLVRMVEFITTGFNRKWCAAAAFFDVQKAFDRVWHQGLLLKMKRSGFPLWQRRLIESYLTGRTFTVIWGRAISTARAIRAGVPHGSVLGPVLFNIFTADIPRDFGWNTIITLFADDAAVVARSRRPHKAASYLQRTVDRLLHGTPNGASTSTPPKPRPSSSPPDPNGSPAKYKWTSPRRPGKRK